MGRKLWVAELPELRGGQWFFRELWVNGERRTRARHLNRGYLSIASLPDKAPDWTKGHTRFEFRAGDLQAWPSLTNAEVVAMTRWVESRLPVTGLDESARIVNFGKRSVFELQSGDLYYVEHVFEALDAPGGWYADAAAGKLYYAPISGERPDQIEAIAPVLAQVVRMEGKPDAGQFVEHVEFRGLTFAHTEWLFPTDADTAKRAAMAWPEKGSPIRAGGQQIKSRPLGRRCISKLLVTLLNYRVLPVAELRRGHGNGVTRASDFGAGAGLAGRLDCGASAVEPQTTGP